jgi:hypothetical protein
MTKPYTFSFPSHIDPDARTRSSVQEHVLKEPIVRADIGAGFREYLETLGKFYAKDVEASTGSSQEPIRGNGSPYQPPRGAFAMQDSYGD